MSFNHSPRQIHPHIPYNEALLRIEQVARSFNADRTQPLAPFTREPVVCDADECCRHDSSILLVEAVGLRSSATLCAPHSTPQFDTSAMDGFAVNAFSTKHASPLSPVRLQVVDSIAAGDQPCRSIMSTPCYGDVQGSCAEIMTGACFPESLPYLDSVVKIEDVIWELDCPTNDQVASRYVLLKEPVKQFQHRRPSGSDFKQGDVIINQGTVVEPKHVAALASVGYTHIQTIDAVCQQGLTPRRAETEYRLRVGIFSTGAEIVGTSGASENSSQDQTFSHHRVPDSNGPYLVSGLRNACPWIDVEYLGVVGDDVELLTNKFEGAIFAQSFDVIVTSGGVSKGRHDLVRHVVEERLGGRVVFHGVKIRPGAPIMFVSFDKTMGQRSRSRKCRTVFFGAPGNPIAAAVALKFFVIPFVLQLHTKDLDIASRSSPLVSTSGSRLGLSVEETQKHRSRLKVTSVSKKLTNVTVFWLAKQRERNEGDIDIVEDQASYKLRGFLEANCWIIIPASTGETPGEVTYFSSPL